LTDFSFNDKFVKELAEAIPLGEVTVFNLEGKCQQVTHLMAQEPSKGCLFHLVQKKSAVGALRATLATRKKTGSR
jgi:uncharacterized membrane protein